MTQKYLDVFSFLLPLVKKEMNTSPLIEEKSGAKQRCGAMEGRWSLGEKIFAKFELCTPYQIWS